MSALFPNCPVDGCTVPEPCLECQGTVVTVLAFVLGGDAPRKFRDGAFRKLERWAGEDLKPNPARPHAFSTEDMTGELGAAIGVEKKPEPAEGES